MIFFIFTNIFLVTNNQPLNEQLQLPGTEFRTSEYTTHTFIGL